MKPEDRPVAQPSRGAIVSARTLIEGCFRADGTASLRYVYDLAVSLGIAEQTVRLAIRRMQSAGELRQEGRGRAGQLVLSDRGAILARTNASLVTFAFAQDAGLAPWDGQWRLYSFNVPESQRGDRDALRGVLTSLGAVAFAPGSYLTPHDLTPELRTLLPDRLISAHLTEACLSSLRMPDCNDDRAVAEKLWPRAITIEAYTLLETLLDEPPVVLPEDKFGVAGLALQLSEALAHALHADPLLPAELREERWPPVLLRARFLSVWRELRELAPEAPIFLEHEES